MNEAKKKAQKVPSVAPISQLYKTPVEQVRKYLYQESFFDPQNKKTNQYLNNPNTIRHNQGICKSII